MINEIILPTDPKILKVLTEALTETSKTCFLRFSAHIRSIYNCGTYSFSEPNQIGLFLNDEARRVLHDFPADMELIRDEKLINQLRAEAEILLRPPPLTDDEKWIESRQASENEPETTQEQETTIHKVTGTDKAQTLINKAKKARELFNKLIDNPEYELKPDEKELLIKAKSTITKCIIKNFKPSYERALERINPSENTYFNVSGFIKTFGFHDEINPIILEKLTGSFFRYAKEKGYKIISENKNNMKIETIKTIK